MSRPFALARFLAWRALRESLSIMSPQTSQKIVYSIIRATLSQICFSFQFIPRGVLILCG